MSGPLGRAFWMLECPECNSWFSLPSLPAALEDCPSCHHPRDRKNALECREPLGFRTNFKPTDEPDIDIGPGRNRSIHAENRGLSFEPCIDSNLSFSDGQGLRTYRLNRGDWDETTGTWEGFKPIFGQQTLRAASQGNLSDQAIDGKFVSGLRASEVPWDFVPAAAQPIPGPIWLAAPKTTDVLSLSPTKVRAGLALHRIIGPRKLKDLRGKALIDAMSATAVRAAALSATFTLVNRASLELDIDPDEFDVIEPRLYRPNDRHSVPVLQFADHLVNGAGFCARLAERRSGARDPWISELLRSAVSDREKYPLKDFLRHDASMDHARDCSEACYLCLLRYRNQPFHGILDWRLGLSFLKALASVDYPCGLDGNFETDVELADWPRLVLNAWAGIQRQFSKAQIRDVGQLKAIRFDPQAPWALISHPLWDPEKPAGILATAVEVLKKEGIPFFIVDSFNLIRRPVTVRGAVGGGS